MKFKCSVCGKIGGGRKPKNGDGTMYFPRLHYNKNTISGEYCEGCYIEAEWIELRENNKEFLEYLKKHADGIDAFYKDV